jgi:IclR family transcriptional regulator, KDG regulon repressor
VISQNTETPAAPRPAGEVRATARALAILSFLAGPDSDEWSLDEIATGVDLPKSTTHRLIETLRNHGFVIPGRAAGSYRLGIEAAIVGSKAIQAQRPGAEVRRLIANAASEIGETVGLNVLEGRQTVVVEKGIPPRPFSWNLGVGATMPAHACAVGKVLLSGMDDDAVRERLGPGEELPPSGSKSIANVGELLEHLAFVRLNGYAIDDEEYEDGLRCVAVPVVDRRGEITHAIGITAPTSRISHRELVEHSKRLAELSREVGSYLGFSAAGGR